jgi:hypothetical protein
MVVEGRPGGLQANRAMSCWAGAGLWKRNGSGHMGRMARGLAAGGKEWWAVVKGQASKLTGLKERRNRHRLLNLLVNFLEFESNKILQIFIQKIGGKI